MGVLKLLNDEFSIWNILLYSGWLPIRAKATPMSLWAMGTMAFVLKHPLGWRIVQFCTFISPAWASQWISLAVPLEITTWKAWSKYFPQYSKFVDNKQTISLGWLWRQDSSVPVWFSLPFRWRQDYHQGLRAYRHWIRSLSHQWQWPLPPQLCGKKLPRGFTYRSFRSSEWRKVKAYKPSIR